MEHYRSSAEYLADLVRWGRTILQDKERGKALAGDLEEKASLSLAAGVFLPVEYLGLAFGLGSFERHCVRLALLPEVDPWFEKAFAEWHGEESRRLLSPELAWGLYSAGEEESLHWQASLGRDGLLRRYLFTVTESKSRSDLTASWKLEQRIKDFALAGCLDNPALAEFAFLWEPDLQEESLEEDLEQTEEESCAEKDMAERMERFLALAGEKEGVVFLFSGPAGSGKKEQILRFCQNIGQAVLFVDVKKILQRERTFQEVLHNLGQECILRQSLLCFDGLEALNERQSTGEALAAACLETALSWGNVVFATCREAVNLAADSLSGRLMEISLPWPNEERRRFLWQKFAAAYTLEDRISLEEFADKFVFTPGQIRQVLAEAENLACWRGLKAIDWRCLYESCYQRMDHGLEGTKAQKVPTVFAWEDLILPPASKELLSLACDQVRYKHLVYSRWGFGEKLPYGRGLSLLFSGPPGTGKTMGAQVVAKELQLELYKVDLAGVVSKYIGETEKNLAEVFREGKKSQAILFFDEADVLFGKRTEVKDSHDKYSNMEAAFMLQKIEEYEGVCILATNYMQNFDEAFKRRIKFVVEFPFPGPEYRLQLWKVVFPADTPLGDDVDWDFLAQRFELSGSSIKNIALNASFRAAAKEQVVTMAEILPALRNETAKSGKIISPEELGEYYMLA